jgi:hypothetical protein
MLEHAGNPLPIDDARDNGVAVEFWRDTDGMVSDPRSQLATDARNVDPIAPLHEVDDGSVIAGVADREVDPMAIAISSRDDDLVVGRRVAHDDTVLAALAAVEPVPTGGGVLGQVDLGLEPL